MKRLEEYKYLRKQRKKCIYLLLFFLVLICSGILVSDYCMNSMVNNEEKLNILHTKNEDDSAIEISIMDKVINLHFKGVKNDLENLKNSFIGLGKIFIK